MTNDNSIQSPSSGTEKTTTKSLIITPTDNKTILATLEEKKNFFAAGYGLTSSMMVGGTATCNPFVAIGGLAGSGYILQAIEKLARIIRVGKAFVDNFESMGVRLIPCIEVPKINPLDLLVEFNNCFLYISIRSMGKASILYNEKLEILQVKRKDKGLNKWYPDPISELNTYQYYMSKNNHGYGITSYKMRSPYAKILLISGETTLGQHRKELYTTLGGREYLALPKTNVRGTTFVITENMIIDFAKAYLDEVNAKQKRS